MSQRRQIVLPDPVDQQLRELAAGADTPPSTLAAQMVQAGVAQAAKDGKVRPLRQAQMLVGSHDGERAPWLEPYGGDYASRLRCKLAVADEQWVVNVRGVGYRLTRYHS